MALSPSALDARSVRPVLDHIANKWAVLILTVLCPQPARFNGIMRRLDGITHKALADALKRLERNGLVTRKVLPTAPVGVEYAITSLGLSLQEPFEALYNWALANGTKLQEAQASYDLTRVIEEVADGRADGSSAAVLSQRSRQASG